MIPTRAPLPFDPEAGDRAVEACAPPADWAEVVRGAGGSAPYLAGLFAREADWLGDVWGADPGAALDELLSVIASFDGDPGVMLREAKRRVAALVALADLGGVWTTMEATVALTRFADAALDKCLTFEISRQKGLPDDSGLVAMAMGKMGAFELNYSSDIDLILLFDQSRHAPDSYAAVRAGLIKAARRAVAQMSDNKAGGYVFRTDLRLRPDPSSTPIVIAVEAAERYYEGFGRAWERAAWIKARPAAGDLAVGEALLETLRPFVWRRHLDFAAVEDAHAMRLGIRAHKDIRTDWDVPGHDMKLGQGGIREIEFFTQTRQIIAGGRDTDLRVRGTLKGLDCLSKAGWVPTDVANELGTAYRHLRDVEHRLQMVQDAQTHRMPRDPDSIRRIACLMGEGDPDRFVRQLRSTLETVERIVDPFFAPSKPEAMQVVSGAAEAEARWRSYPALRSERALASFERVKPTLMAGFARATRPEEALAAFDGFLAGLPSGVQLFALFEATPKLVALIVDICAVSPDIARHLSKNSSVLDAVLDGSFFAPLGQFEAPEPPNSFEDALNALRLWHRDAHFRIGVHFLRRLVTPVEAGRAYTRLAEATLAAAWSVAEAEMARRYGRVAGLRVAGLAMGSLGAGRLTAQSDLDLVVLHDGGDGPSDGPRALQPGQWAAKFTQVLITALTAQMGAGRLYEVDMRLRPSGRQGPVAVALSSFRSYQAEEAWVWEHLALTRARAIAGDTGLCADVEAARRAVLAGQRFAPAEVVEQTAEMLARLRAGSGGFDMREGPGRLQRIEIIAQAHALIAASAAQTTPDQLAIAGWLTPEERAEMARAHALMADVQSVFRLIGSPGDGLAQAAEDLLANTTGLADVAAVQGACAVAAKAADAAITLALARGAS